MKTVSGIPINYDVVWNQGIDDCWVIILRKTMDKTIHLIVNLHHYTTTLLTFVEP